MAGRITASESQLRPDPKYRSRLSGEVHQLRDARWSQDLGGTSDVRRARGDRVAPRERAAEREPPEGRSRCIRACDPQREAAC